MNEPNLDVFRIQLKQEDLNELERMHQFFQNDIDLATQHAFNCKRQLTAIEEEMEKRKQQTNE